MVHSLLSGPCLGWQQMPSGLIGCTAPIRVWLLFSLGGCSTSSYLTVQLVPMKTNGALGCGERYKPSTGGTTPRTSCLTWPSPWWSPKRAPLNFLVLEPRWGPWCPLLWSLSSHGTLKMQSVCMLKKEWGTWPSAMIAWAALMGLPGGTCWAKPLDSKGMCKGSMNWTQRGGKSGQNCTCSWSWLQRVDSLLPPGTTGRKVLEGRWANKATAKGVGLALWLWAAPPSPNSVSKNTSPFWSNMFQVQSLMAFQLIACLVKRVAPAGKLAKQNQERTCQLVLSCIVQHDENKLIPKHR